MREITIVINGLIGKANDIIERTRDYLVKIDENSMIYGEFYNNTIEDITVKITITGRKEHGTYEVLLGNEKKVQEAGKKRLEGKDYLMQDGDIVLFRFNV